MFWGGMLGFGGFELLGFLFPVCFVFAFLGSFWVFAIFLFGVCVFFPSFLVTL